jgi:hypothetical protein
MMMPKQIANPPIQPQPVGRVSTIEAILSVTEA